MSSETKYILLLMLEEISIKYPHLLADKFE